MDFTDVLSQFLSDPKTGYRTGLRFFHFIGLAMGLGGATLLDLMLLRFFVRGRITEDTYGVFAFASRIVDIGLRLLWITGLGFLFLYALTQPELLTNPKVHAKLAIVAILTVNGFFIHQIILPSVRRQIGRTLFNGVGATRRAIFVTSGAISVVSWYMPVALGAFPQLNFHVSSTTLLTGYFALIVVVALAMQALIYLLHRFVPEFDTPLSQAAAQVQQFRRTVVIPSVDTGPRDLGGAPARARALRQSGG
ncbi:hypothetical protein SAMN05444339_10855 [Loktanella atrilutea]|uniref:Uncharacterized protein n=2 Tax=Loktanella atrilutea TaxID=366533 RepID=A0A1M5CQP2_LOKAT|nr:hypothetical protein SAMN05444339_10855 [Loktanella atrilutea]